MIINSIVLWIIISILMNMSGNVIGFLGMRKVLLNVLIISPIVSWIVLYNIIFVCIDKNSSVYSISYDFISLYNYNLCLSLDISVYLSIIIILLINVSFVINLYIVRYLYCDKNIVRFVSNMMLFTFSMMLLILSNDMITLFIGWEMIGITSLILISYYNNRIESVRSGLKAIMYNRLGDVSLMCAIIICINMFLSSNLVLYSLLFNYSYYNCIYNNKLMLLIGICIIISAWSKSAQLGFQPWLLDAMEGPTPVSALLHSATLITAGVVILYKFSYLLYFNSSLMILVLLLSCVSCLMNSFSSINYLDIKRIVAYSTCTHVSLMILIVSLDIIVSIREISLLHLFYHGWSKSLIFILCGYLISIFHSQDIRLFGNIYLQLPLLFCIINLSLLTIYGFPGTSISSSKDIILEFGLLSIYGSSLLIPFFMILLLSQGYSLGILLYLLYNSSYNNNVHSFYIYYKDKFLYSFYVLFLFVILLVIYLPLLLHDLLIYYNIHVSHHLINVDVFSLLSLVGLLISYYNYRSNNILGIQRYFNVSNNRLLFDKLFSSISSLFSVFILYSSTFVLEYGYILSYLHIVNLCIVVLLI
jgi:NADH:ubiquinone oxidoreductase subunit 5 (subunit L)/multisubunit Na+/H+ antiporter MnhA subunit